MLAFPMRATTGHGLRLATDDIASLLGLNDGESFRTAARAAQISGLTDDGSEMAVGDYFRLLRWMAPVAGRETFALSERPILCGGKALAYARAAAAETLGGALRALAETYNLLHGGAYNRVARGNGLLTFSVCDSGFPYTDAADPRLWFVLECALLGVHAAACELAGVDVSPWLLGVTTRRPGPQGPGAAALGVWPVAACLGRETYSLTFDEAVAELPVCDAFRRCDQPLAVHERILKLVEAPHEEDWSVAAAVRRLLGEDPARDQTAVADRLGMSGASLRRRLAQEGASFRGLHQEALMAEACSRLGRTADLDDLAESLGFSDRRAFRRAFKAWTGLTPNAYRDRAAGGG